MLSLFIHLCCCSNNKEEEKELYYKSIYNDGFQEKDLPFIPMIVEKEYNNLPTLHFTALDSEHLKVDIPKEENFIHDRHYINYDNYVFDPIPNLKIYPPCITNALIDPKKPSNFTISVTNLDPNTNININKIYSTSQYILVSHTNPKTLGPGKTLKFSFTILFDKGGEFSSIIAIETENGTIPYYVNYQIEPGIFPLVTPTTVFLAQSDIKQINYKFDLGINQRSVVYDSSIFDTGTAGLSNFFLLKAI